MEGEAALEICTSTTILFFVRFPEIGRVKTRLASALGAERACEIHTQMAEFCFGQMRRIEPARLVVCGTGAWASAFQFWLPGASEYWLQPSLDLGGRLEEMFARAFEQGATKAFAVGSDAPGLDAEGMTRASAHLEDHDVSILPAVDGGYVTIGLTQPRPYLFRDMPWGTPVLLEETVKRCDREGLQAYLGPRYRDVDTADDWRELASLSNNHT